MIRRNNKSTGIDQDSATRSHSTMSGTRRVFHSTNIRGDMMVTKKKTMMMLVITTMTVKAQGDPGTYFYLYADQCGSALAASRNRQGHNSNLVTRRSSQQLSPSKLRTSPFSSHFYPHLTFLTWLSPVLNVCSPEAAFKNKPLMFVSWVPVPFSNSNSFNHKQSYEVSSTASSLNM